MEKYIKLSKSQKKQVKSMEDSFDYKMDILKIEIDIIERSIDRIDNMSKSTRHLSILVWAGSIALSIGQDVLRKYIIFTSIIPLLFWFADSCWAYLRYRFIRRRTSISHFLNSADLQESFKKRELVNFKILDPKEKEYRQKPLSEKLKVFLSQVVWYPELCYFYLGLFFISIFIGFYFSRI